MPSTFSSVEEGVLHAHTCKIESAALKCEHTILYAAHTQPGAGIPLPGAQVTGGFAYFVKDLLDSSAEAHVREG